LARLFVATDAYAVVLLAAFATENERQEDTTAVARHKLLSVDRQVALRLRVQGSIDGVTAADKLMQAEGEHRQVCFRVRFAMITA